MVTGSDGERVEAAQRSLHAATARQLQTRRTCAQVVARKTSHADQPIHGTRTRPLSRAQDGATMASASSRVTHEHMGVACISGVHALVFVS